MKKTTQQEATIEQAKKIGLTQDEFEKIKTILRRTPNSTEIGIYSVMWSDHYSNKNSIQWLQQLPRVDETIDFGEGLGCTIKFEKNGKINKEVFWEGTTPVAQINAFYFGNIEEKNTKQDIKSTIKGIKDHIPIVGNKVFFNNSYNSNPTVHEFSAGIVDTSKMIPVKATGVGNSVFIVQMDNSSKQKESLSNAIDELVQSDAVVGLNNLSRGGIIGSASEMSFSGSFGIELSIDKVISQQKSLKTFEILTSDSNGLLLIVKNGKEQVVKDIFKKAGLNLQEIGAVNDGENVRCIDGNSLLVDLPSKSLVRGHGTPQAEKEFKEPSYYQELKEFEIESIIQPEDLKEIAIFLLKHQNIASKKWVDEQINSTIKPGKMNSDASVVNIEGTKKALVVSLDSNPRYVNTDPQKGAAITLAQAARNIICSGGTPKAISYNLNFGNSNNPEHYWQFVEVIKGMTEVCSKMNTSVTVGNVSFDEGASKDKLYTSAPSIGMVGVSEKENVMSLDFKYKGDLIFILGENIEDIGSSEYLASYHNIKKSPAPHFDLAKEVNLQETVKQLIQTKYVNAVHSVSEGGIFMALAEMGMANELGFDIVTDAEVREDAFLYGEASGRVIATVSEDFEDEFIEFMMNSKTQFTLLGHVTKGKMVVDDEHYGFIKEAKDIYENALGLYIEK
ncbi:MAG: phosphoribosylformylglycinamidine synthase II [Fluviicola sp.]|nr:MAG: phosphoribosylformylglycinamidine synthase II [Fluviicola sp.]